MQSRRWMAALGTGLAMVAAAAAQDVLVQHPRCLLLMFDPIIESHAAQRLHQVGGWNDPLALTLDYVDDFETSSHGIVNYQLVQTIKADVFPILEDGFRYTDDSYMACLNNGSGWHQSGRDYKAVARDYDLARKVDAGMFDEVFDHSAPYFGGYETRFLGRGGYWCNSPPQTRIACSKLFVVSVFNYERGVDCMVHDQGHRTESIMRRVYGSWNMTNPHHLWDRFTLNYGASYPQQTVFGVGNCHYPMNAESDYDYSNPRYVECTAPLWLTMDPNDPGDFPDLTGTPAVMNRDEWGGPDYGRNYVNWFFYHLPRFPDRNNKDGYDRLNNWWEYVQNFNAHPESGGDHLLGGDPPPAVPYTNAKRMMTANSQDDWFPVMNDSGRIVWQGLAGFDYEIFSMNADGTGLVAITDNGYDDEAPQINAFGRIVWQGFDGQDYEIFCANADGTGFVQITNNEVNDWQPQINNYDRIVWSSFDGEDYEIYCAYSNGSGLTQITDNTHNGVGKPRDDVWPQIDNEFPSPHRIVWMGYNGSQWQIYSAYPTGAGLTNVSNNSVENEYPQIDDSGRVVWQAWLNDVNAEIYSADAAGSSSVRLSSNTGEDWWPQINNNGDVVWMSRVGSDWEIMTCPATGGTAQAITDNDSHDQYPRIDDNGRVVWQGFDGQDWEIYEYADGTIYQVTDNDYHDRWPSLGGDDGIVWHAESTPGPAGNSTEIWAAGTLTADVTPPTIEGVLAKGAHDVRVSFSEPVEQNSAENIANYSIEPGVTIITAVLHPDPQSVIVTTSTLTPDVTYTLTVNNVTDIALNPVAPNTQEDFVYSIHERVSDGLAVLYNFDEGAGTVVHDVSGVATPLDLIIQDPGNVTWTSGGLSLEAETSVASAGAATKIINACQATNEVTIEAWIVPASAVQGGPARIVTLSRNLSSRAFTLGHGTSSGDPADVFDVRLRTTETSGNGLPSLTTPTGVVTGGPAHVIYTRAADGAAVIYVDNDDVAATTVGGTFSTWSTSCEFALGNEFWGSKPWLGEYRLVAVYDRALGPAEVTQNYLAGPDGGANYLPGDVNCDGVVGFGDINPFVLAISNPQGYAKAYPECPFENRDANGDGVFGFGDINPFVGLLTGSD